MSVPEQVKEPIGVTMSFVAADPAEDLSPPANDVVPSKFNVLGYHIDEFVRFRALTAALWAGICVSVIFGFGLIADFMRNTYHYDQRQLTTISTTGLVFGYFTFPFGVLFDYAGPLPLFVVGTIMMVFGTLMFALTFSGFIASSVVLFSFYIAVLNLGCGLFDVASVSVLMDVFPRNRGPIAALVKTTSGLGISVLAAFYSGFFDRDAAHFYYFVVVAMIIIGPIFCCCIRLPPYVVTGYQKTHNCLEVLNAKDSIKKAYMITRPSTARIIYGYAAMIILLLFLTIVSITNIYLSISKGMHLTKAIITVILLLLFAGMAVPLPCIDGTKRNNCKDTNAANGGHPGGEEPAERGDLEMSDEALPEVDPQYDTSFWKSFLSVDSWCFFWISFWAWGAGLTLLLNVSEIFQALDPSTDGKTVFLYVTLNGVGSALGRLGIGLFETLLIRRAKALAKRGSSTLKPMTIAYPVGTLLLMIGYVLFLILPGKIVFLASIIASCGYGYNSTCTAVIVRTLWSKDAGKYYNFAFVGPMIAAVALNRFLFGELYDAAAIANGSKGRCVGRNCVQTSFIVMIIGCATSVVAAIIIHIRFVHFLIAKRKVSFNENRCRLCLR